MPDIYLLGIGQRFPGHLTLDVLETMDLCQSIYTLLDDGQIAQLPSAIGAKCHAVFPWYREDQPRAANYARVIEAVLAAAREVTPVGWLTWGNPRVLDSVSQGLLDFGTKTGLSVAALPAVSSLDTVLIDVGHDPANGLLVVEGTTALRDGIAILPNVATLIFQPGTFGSNYPHLSSARPPVDLSPLRDYLLRFYATQHSLAFVSSSTTMHHPARITWTTIGQLVEVDPNLLQQSTIFIPPFLGAQ